MRLALRCDVPWNSAWSGGCGRLHPLAGADPISRLMELSLRGLYRQYIGIVALSMPAAGLFMVTSMSLQAPVSLRPALAAIALNIVNAVVSAGLPHPDWGGFA